MNKKYSTRELRKHFKTYLTLSQYLCNSNFPQKSVRTFRTTQWFVYLWIFTWNNDRKLSAQFSCKLSLIAWDEMIFGTFALEFFNCFRGNKDSHGKHGCCQYKQHWWNWAFGEVSNEVLVLVSKQRTKLQKRIFSSHATALIHIELTRLFRKPLRLFLTFYSTQTACVT